MFATAYSNARHELSACCLNQKLGRVKNSLSPLHSQRTENIVDETQDSITGLNTGMPMRPHCSFLIHENLIFSWIKNEQ